jgi:uncharacterized protein (DUF433 family)
MSTLKELEPQLLALSPSDQAAVIQLLSDRLSNSSHPIGISKTTDVMGGEACIRNTRIPVWLLVSYRNLGLSEAELLENYPTIDTADLSNAWAYAEAFPEEIDLAIRQQEAA